MEDTIKQTAKSILPHNVYSLIKKQFAGKQLRNWEKEGCPVPPPHIVKQITIREYQAKYKYNILVETGTYLGDMIEAQKKNFKRIFSVELSVELFNKAKKRFRNYSNVTLLQGDSGKVLPEIVEQLHEPAIFWLDGHYSAGETAKGDKDCPIFEELDSIFKGKKLNHVMLIDDARHFTGEFDYPTIEELTRYIKSKNEKYSLEVKNDIIRLVV